ncbi:MAG: hypothetical protein ABUL77_01355 [Bacteroidota bacterium]
MRTTRSRARQIIGGAVALAVLLGGTGAAKAQLLEPPRRHQGYYFSVGYNFALNKNWEDGQSWGVWPGADLILRAGQVITRRFGLGLQIHSGGTAREGQRASLFGLSIEGNWELVTNLTVRGGAGLDVVNISSANGMDDKLRGTVGSGYFLGLGYDWFFGKRASGGFALAPVIQARFVPGTTTSAFIGVVGLQMSYYAGLPRNQLELPPEEAFKRK